MRGSVVVAVVGLVAGALLAYGGAVVLFDLAHQGSNTEPLQVLFGFVLPGLAILVTWFRLRGDGKRRRKVAVLAGAVALGFVAGFAALLLLF